MIRVIYSIVQCVSKCIRGLKSALEPNVRLVIYQVLLSKSKIMIIKKKNGLAQNEQFTKMWPGT